jgi:hypothetical protein
MTSTDTMLAAALDLARLGYAVFPVKPGGKAPATKHGVLDATVDPATIALWWADIPEANIGLATDGLLVLDLDVLNGQRNPFPADADKIDDLLAAPIVSTPRGGSHHYFLEPAGKQYKNTAGKLSPGVDTRARGGYVITPPSFTDVGGYRWEIPLPPRDDLPPPPAWLAEALDALAKPKAAPSNGTPRQQPNGLPRYVQAALDAELGRVAMARNGSRNDQLNKSAHALGTLIGAGALDRGTVEELLADAAAKCGLPGDEAARTIKSGIDAGVSQPRKLPEGRQRYTPKPSPSKPSDNGKHEPAADTPRTGAEIILDYFRQRWQPVFRRGNVVHCADGEEVTQQIVCVPDSRILAGLAHATDVPKDKHGVNTDALPGFFKKWAPVAWGDLRGELPEEINAVLGDDAPARETFVRLVREAMFAQITFGDVIGRQGVTQVERRSLMGWAAKFAKPGPWRDVRSLACWCRLTEPTAGEQMLHVAIRHELFAQVAADRRLREMGATMFARLAGKYGVGTSTEKDRPHGRRAIVLDPAFVADMMTGVDDENLPVANEDEQPPEVPASFSDTEKGARNEPAYG